MRTHLHGRRYFRDGMNIFDCLVVVISVTEMVLDIIPSVSGLGPLSVLRAFRLLRIFRLARSWRDLNIIIRGMFNSVKASFMLVLLMVRACERVRVLGSRDACAPMQACSYALPLAARRLGCGSKEPMSATHIPSTQATRTPIRAFVWQVLFLFIAALVGMQLFGYQ